MPHLLLQHKVNVFAFYQWLWIAFPQADGLIWDVTTSWTHCDLIAGQSVLPFTCFVQEVFLRLHFHNMITKINLLFIVSTTFFNFCKVCKNRSGNMRCFVSMASLKCLIVVSGTLDKNCATPREVKLANDARASYSYIWHSWGQISSPVSAFKTM